MNSKSKTLSLFVGSFALLTGVRSAIAFEPVTTLDKLRDDTYFYSPETPFSLIEKYADGYTEVKINGDSYYFNPEDDTLAKLIASTPAANLVAVGVEEADFEYNGNFYAFDSNSIPTFAYKIVEGTAVDNHFSNITIDENDALVEEFYKIAFTDDEGAPLFDNSSSISWEEVGKSGTDIVSVKLPNSEEKHYKYTHIAQDGRKLNDSTPDDLTGDINSDFIGNANIPGGAISNMNNSRLGKISGDFVKNTSVSTGGAIFNLGSIESITGIFIDNQSSGAGGAIFNVSLLGIGNITGDFVANHVSSTGSQAYGGAIYNNGSKIGNITGNFIGNYVHSSNSNYNVQGGAIYNSSNSSIDNITGDFIGNYSTSARGYSDNGGAIYNYGSSKIGNITGNFIGNYTSSYGGAIYNNYHGNKINSITGNFIENYVDSTQYDANGGAISNDGGTTIGEIKGNFIKNHTSSSDSYAS